MIEPSHRIALLACLMAVVAGIDRILKGRDATRWREYLLLLTGGGAGALFGALHDQITVSISTEYYRLGKEVVHPNLRWGVLVLGAQTGFAAGVVLLGGYLLAARERTTLRLIVKFASVVILGALPAAVLGALFGGRVIPDSLAAFYEVPPAAAASFKTVAAEHYGLYAGAIIGAIVGAILIRTRWSAHGRSPRTTAG